MSSALSSPDLAPFPPSGWYHDPLGLPQLRWWNGMMWTNQIEEPRPEVQITRSTVSAQVGAP